MGGEGGQWNGHVSHSSHFAEMGGVVIAKKQFGEKVHFKIGHEELDFSGQGYKGKNNYGSRNIPP